MTKDPSLDPQTNPEDFGLPIVDLSPIKGKSSKNVSAKNPIKPTSKTEKEVSAEDKILAAKKVASKKEQAIKTEAIAKEIPDSEETKVETKTAPAKPEPKKSNAWVMPVIIILIGLVSLIVWQILGDSPESIESTKSEIAVAETPLEVPADITPKEQEQEPEAAGENSQSVPAEGNSVKPVDAGPEKVENGTTIEQNKAGELVRIETKPTPSQYFIVVGSLPSEQLALDEVDKYWDRAESLYLLSPNPESKNYRLAISKHNGFTSANAELQRVKSEYTEALWILKY